MLGGVSGHAGLFSNANDLAKLLQMLLNKGSYGGEQFLQAQTIEKFTTCAFCENGNRKAFGFDRPEADSTKADNTGKCTSQRSYGHTGFTGTIMWVDPEYDLLYIFLSNRIHPDASNTLLSSMQVRSNVQKVIYESLKPAQTL
jgi:CubicO group peptidase (beta-lactamase class C family)